MGTINPLPGTGQANYLSPSPGGASSSYGFGSEVQGVSSSNNVFSPSVELCPREGLYDENQQVIDDLARGVHKDVFEDLLKNWSPDSSSADSNLGGLRTIDIAESKALEAVFKHDSNVESIYKNGSYAAKIGVANIAIALSELSHHDGNADYCVSKQKELCALIVNDKYRLGDESGFSAWKQGNCYEKVEALSKDVFTKLGDPSQGNIFERVMGGEVMPAIRTFIESCFGPQLLKKWAGINEARGLISRPAAASIERALKTIRATVDGASSSSARLHTRANEFRLAHHWSELMRATSLAPDQVKQTSPQSPLGHQPASQPMANNQPPSIIVSPVINNAPIFNNGPIPANNNGGEQVIVESGGSDNGQRLQTSKNPSVISPDAIDGVEGNADTWTHQPQINKGDDTGPYATGDKEEGGRVSVPTSPINTSFTTSIVVPSLSRLDSSDTPQPQRFKKLERPAPSSPVLQRVEQMNSDEGQQVIVESDLSNNGQRFHIHSNSNINDEADHFQQQPPSELSFKQKIELYDKQNIGVQQPSSVHVSSVLTGNNRLSTTSWPILKAVPDPSHKYMDEKGKNWRSDYDGGSSFNGSSWDLRVDGAYQRSVNKA
ncbi:hypothetical protein [Solimicrobium silvestre]|uniref:Uncharacterized protein n=1 Tax=Solimicrobium silvestre TaxID=2099400 RepID=A0A2S9H1M1_9BURK|nr:hypothetical protein [Solimicrobium silvestre]PRC93872.1 hypothetical protein S2091_1481 [Solimicrobium silvestre]